MLPLHQRGIWLRELNLNQRPSDYESDELPDCSIPQYKYHWDIKISNLVENGDTPPPFLPCKGSVIVLYQFPVCERIILSGSDVHIAFCLIALTGRIKPPRASIILFSILQVIYMEWFYTRSKFFLYKKFFYLKPVHFLLALKNSK